MKALTVRQPWAWAIIHGGKDIENRTQAWSYRGPLAIHAGLRLDAAAFTSPKIRPPDALSSWRAHYVDGEARVAWPTPRGKWGMRLPLGAIIGVVDLVDVHVARWDCCSSDWGEAAQTSLSKLVHLELTNPRPLAEPIPCRGALGLWMPPVEVRAQLELILGVDEWVDEIRSHP